MKTLYALHGGAESMRRSGLFLCGVCVGFHQVLQSPEPLHGGLTVDSKLTVSVDVSGCLFLC